MVETCIIPAVLIAINDCRYITQSLSGGRKLQLYCCHNYLSANTDYVVVYWYIIMALHSPTSKKELARDQVKLGPSMTISKFVFSHYVTPVSKENIPSHKLLFVGSSIKGALFHLNILSDRVLFTKIFQYIESSYKKMSNTILPFFSK